MSRATVLTRKLGIRHPVIQAPLAGGGDTPALVATVCEAGALGFVGASYLTPLQIVETSRAVRAQTTRPFGINLFAPLHASEAPLEPGGSTMALVPQVVDAVTVPRDRVGWDHGRPWDRGGPRASTRRWPWRPNRQCGVQMSSSPRRMLVSQF